MKYWTVQSQEVLQIIERDGVYYPQFTRSQYYEKYSTLYDFMLESFNNVNNFEYEGLIYAFCVSDRGMIHSISNIEGFRYFLNLNKDKILYLWKHFKDNNYKILELVINMEFNDLSLSFNDFQYVMPSAINELLFDPIEYKTKCEWILSNVKKGIATSSGEAWDLIQSHLPYIKKTDIKNIYEIFSLD